MDFDYIFRVLASEYAVPLTEHTVTYFENFANNFVKNQTISCWFFVILFAIFLACEIFFLVKESKKYITRKKNKLSTAGLISSIVFDCLMTLICLFYVINWIHNLYMILTSPETEVIKEFISWCV